MNYEFLQSFTIDDLKEMKKILGESADNGKVLLQKINDELTIREKEEYIKNCFSSSRMPYYRLENEDICNQIMSKININELFFLGRSFMESGHKMGDIRILKAKDKNILTDISNIYDVSFYTISHILTYRNHYFLNQLPLVKMEEIFQNEEYVIGYESVYNCYQYIKNYVYQCLIENKEATKEDVFQDFSEKKEIVTKNLGEIANYLYEIRKYHPKARLSICNAGLSRTARKTGIGITYHQNVMIEAIAFGTTKEKLEDKNYEDAKRLIYLPKS